MTFLQQFDHQFEYRPGRQHGNADALFQQPPEEPDVIAVIQDMFLTGSEEVQVAQTQYDRGAGSHHYSPIMGRGLASWVALGTAGVLPPRRSSLVLRVQATAINSAHIQVVLLKSLRQTIPLNHKHRHH